MITLILERVIHTGKTHPEHTASAQGSDAPLDSDSAMRRSTVERAAACDRRRVRGTLEWRWEGVGKLHSLLENTPDVER